MKSLGLLFALTARVVCAAEPEIAPGDLPRVSPTEPAGVLRTFQIKEGFKIELAASEPLVVDPIAMCFDENARLFVIEMRDYSERRDERLGRIKMLEDTDGDRKFDRATIFAEGLPWPTALIWYGGGLFVGSTPEILYFKDTDGDGRADQRRVVFTGFGSEVQRLNVQQLLNSFTWGLDNRIHGANGGNGGRISSPQFPDRPAVELRGSDFSFDPVTLDFRRESGGGQHGLTFDNYGRKFVCSNSSHIRQVMYRFGDITAGMRHALPPPSIDIAVDGPAAEVFRTSPDEPWRVLRTRWRVAGLVAGPIEGGGRPSGYFTGATGVTIYRGDALGSDAVGNAFIADIGSNLAHRKELQLRGVEFQAQRPSDEIKREFLTSTDNWFRPTGFANGPDGALYIIDMYRETIEHPWSIPPNLKKHLDLNSGNDRGRIYRVVRDDFKPLPLDLPGRVEAAHLVALLASPNGWTRDTATRLLVERKDGSMSASVRAVRGLSDVAHLHALAVLQGLKALAEEDLVHGLTSPHAVVREFTLTLCSRENLTARLESLFSILALDPSVRVRFELAWAIARSSPEEFGELVARMMTREPEGWELHAILATASINPDLVLDSPTGRRLPVEVRGRITQFARREKGSAPKQTPALPRGAPATGRDEVLKTFAGAASLQGNSAKGQTIFTERCASCHRVNGLGVAVGPDLESVRSAGKETLLANILYPNREVAARFAAYEIQTMDGDSYTGVLAADAANGVTLRQASGIDVFLPVAEIRTFRPLNTSLMPEGLEEGLTAQAIADLMAFLLAD